MSDSSQIIVTSKTLTEIHAVPIEEDGFVFYAPLRRTAWIGNDAARRVIERLRRGERWRFTWRDNKLVEFLDRLGLFRDTPDQEPLSPPVSPWQPTRLTLLLTTNCTLRCRYCYASAGDRLTNDMTIETAVRGIDWIAGNAVAIGASMIKIFLHGGGEPTANWPVLVGATTQARRRAAEHGLQSQITLATNAVLDTAKVDWIVANLDGMTVSFDGLPVVHDRNRRLANGAPSSGYVLKTLRRLDEREFSYGIRSTVTADAIASLPDSIEFIYKNCRPTMVQVEPVYQFGRGEGAESAETEEFIHAYRAAQQRARELGGNLAMSPVRIGALTDHFCEATKGSFCLTTSGNVTSCYEVFAEDLPWASHFFFARLNQRGGYEIDEDVLNKLQEQSVHKRRYCRDCFARWDCAGDCYHKALMANGEGEIKGTGRCRIIRELSKDMLLDRIAACGGIVWQDGAVISLSSGE